ncbi:hypothetical protein AOLI_G00289720 [Acnodon oligacanthus]
MEIEQGVNYALDKYSGRLAGSPDLQEVLQSSSGPERSQLLQTRERVLTPQSENLIPSFLPGAMRLMQLMS